MSQNSNFLGLALELRQMVYRELLVLDHRGGSWEWSLDCLSAFNRRHAVTRVNSQVRREAQEILYAYIPWRLRIGDCDNDLWECKSVAMIEDILPKLTPTQLSHIRELSLVYVITEPKTDNPTKEFCTFVFEHLSAVRRLSITWHDHAPDMKWEEKKILLEPLAGLQHVSSIIIREGSYQTIRFPKNGGELAKCINDIVSGANIELR